jgi:hypothetical protein
MRLQRLPAKDPLGDAQGLIAGMMIGLGTWAVLIGAGILVWRFLL